jgi:hypothetical protein
LSFPFSLREFKHSARDTFFEGKVRKLLRQRNSRQPRIAETRRENGAFASVDGESWIAVQPTFVEANFVPLEAIEQSEKRPFAALVREAKAAARIAVFSLNWRASVQRAYAPCSKRNWFGETEFRDSSKTTVFETLTGRAARDGGLQHGFPLCSALTQAEHSCKP